MCCGSAEPTRQPATACSASRCTARVSPASLAAATATAASSDARRTGTPCRAQGRGTARPRNRTATGRRRGGATEEAAGEVACGRTGRVPREAERGRRAAGRVTTDTPAADGRRCSRMRRGSSDEPSAKRLQPK